MLGRLSYEPSTQATLADVLPAGSRVIAEPQRLRERVSWPLVARATGLGEIQGGELILVPAAHTERIVASAASLALSGVAGLVIAGELSEAEEASIRGAGIPVALVPASTDMRRLQEDLERYIIRRRRELFQLGQNLHRTLVEGAIGGAEVQELLERAETWAQKPVLLDREGDLLLGAEPAEPIADTLLLQIRIACHGAVAGCVFTAGPPSWLALPVVTGKERRGIVALLEVSDASLDEDEALLTTLASACAIALAREPEVGTPFLGDLFSDAAPGQEAARLRQQGSSWVALALQDLSVPLSRLERAVSSELTARGAELVLGRHGDALVALIDAQRSLSWEAVVQSLQVRLASTALRAGVGRPYAGLAGAQKTAGEALEALARGGEESLTRYEAIELQVMLQSIQGWEQFTHRRLGPLLEDLPGRQELVQTLRVYLATGMNATEAARRLQIHRNTLLYRIQRIRELLQLDWDDSEEIFGLDLALRILAAHEERGS